VTNGCDLWVWCSFLWLLVTATAVGLLAGLLGVGFHWLVAHLHEWVTGHTGTILDVGRALPPWARVALPTSGALVGALLLYALGRGETAFGVRDLMEVVSLRRRAIRVGPTLGRIVSALATIASGGSVGREGPIMQIGATAASLVGDATRPDPRSRSILLAAGAAAGMAAAYNAPLAGAVFVMEVVLSNFALDVFVPVVFATATAALVKRALLGADPLYSVDAASVPLTWTLVLCAVPLGVACAPLAIGFQRLLQRATAGFAKLPLHAIARPMLGGLLVGLIGIGSLTGRFAIGALADRVGRPQTLILAQASLGASFIVWALADGYLALALFALWMGTSYGGIVSLMPALCMDRFGARAVSSIIGSLYSAAAIGNLAGPWLAGRIFDATASYAAVTWGCLAMSALSTLCTWAAVRR